MAYMFQLQHMPAIIIYVSPKVAYITKKLAKISAKVIDGEKCISSNVPNKINEIGRNIMDKMATH